jgi:hypothetical protein
MSDYKNRVKEKMITGLRKGNTSWCWTAKRLMGEGGQFDILHLMIGKSHIYDKRKRPH